MRVISGILFLCLIVCNLTGIPIAFKLHQLRIRREIKNQIKAGIPQDQLHHLSFSKEDKAHIRWTKKGKEFSYQGEMYDIVFSRQDGDAIHYYCINDKEEEMLFAKLNELVGKKIKNDSRSNNNLTVKLIRALTSLYIPTENIPTITASHKTISHFTRFTFTLASPFLEFITPPPKFA